MMNIMFFVLKTLREVIVVNQERPECEAQHVLTSVEELARRAVASWLNTKISVGHTKDINT